MQCEMINIQVCVSINKSDNSLQRIFAQNVDFCDDELPLIVHVQHSHLFLVILS